MKTKFKKNGRRLLAAILCLVMAVMALPMSAFAWTSEEGVSCTSSFGDYYVSALTEDTTAANPLIRSSCTIVTATPL